MRRFSLTSFSFPIVVSIAGILVGGCSQSAGPTVAQLPPPTVTVAKPIVRNITDSDEFEGRIEAIEKIDVRARVRGYITKVAFQNGQRVKAGELLFEIDPRPYEAILQGAEARKASAEANLKLANIETERSRQLVEKNAASQSELDQWTGKQGVAQADVLLAEADIEKAKLDVQFTKIVAPIDGKMSRTNVTVGNLVSGTGDVILATLVSTSPLYVRFEVDEKRLLSYRRRAIENNGPARETSSLREAKIPVFVGLDGEQGFPHPGILDSADNTVRSSTGTISALAILENKSGLLDDGMRARVRLPVSDAYKAIMVTDRALGSDQGVRFLFVVNDQNRVERREVSLGRLIGNLQVISRDLKPEERVVVNGIQRVRDGIEVEPREVPMPGDAPLSSKNEIPAGEKPTPPKDAAGATP